MFPSAIHNPAFNLVILAFAVAMAGAVAGLWFSSLPQSTRAVIPFSGGLLVGVALFGLLPEIAEATGWRTGLAVFAAGYLLLLFIDRNLHVVCPSCSHDHDHFDCPRALHGFTTPLLIAASMHALLDGWGLTTVSLGASEAVRVTFPVAVLLHKVPEGLALGAIFHASSPTRWRALGWCVVAESATLAGGAAGLILTNKLSFAWTNYPLALAGGCFLYLGYHAVHGDWKRRGARIALIPALSGLAGAALVQQGVKLIAA